MTRRLHHLNFLVRDLESAAARFAALLGVEAPAPEDLAGRGVRLCRFRAGETWIVLVQPVDRDSEPARRLAAQGEGFFLASFEVDDLQESVERLGRSGIRPATGEKRTGLDGWQVLDLDPACFDGIQLQLVEAATDRRQETD